MTSLNFSRCAMRGGVQIGFRVYFRGTFSGTRARGETRVRVCPARLRAAAHGAMGVLRVDVSFYTIASCCCSRPLCAAAGAAVQRKRKAGILCIAASLCVRLCCCLTTTEGGEDCQCQRQAAGCS